MPKPRPGLGADPLAATPRISPVIPTTPISEDDAEDRDIAEQVAAVTARPKKTGAEPGVRVEGSLARRGPMSLEAGVPKKSYSFYIDVDLLEEARDTVVHLSSDPDGPRTLSGLIEEGVRREVVRLQDQLNNSEPFPHRRVALRRGGNTRDM